MIHSGWNIISKYLGWRHWAVLQYNAYFENLFVVFYIALSRQHFSSAFVTDILVFALFSMAATTYGYLINDYADMELDRRHGKSNTFMDDSGGRALTITLFFLVASLLLSLPFVQRGIFLIWFVLWLLITTFYSMPPVRLKERGAVGLILVIIAQRVLPVLLMFEAFQLRQPEMIALLVIYILFRGSSSDLNHQLEDYENDRRTGTNTFVVKSGYRRVSRLFRFSLEAEKLLLAVILVLIVLKLHYLPKILSIFLFVLVAVYWASYLYSFIHLWKRKGDVQVNPFITEERTIFQFLHHSYPSVLLALGLNVLLLHYNLFYALLLILQMLHRRLFSVQVLKTTYPFQLIKKLMR